MSMLLDLFVKVRKGDVPETALCDWQYTLYCEWLLQQEKGGVGSPKLKPRVLTVDQARNLVDKNI